MKLMKFSSMALLLAALVNIVSAQPQASSVPGETASGIIDLIISKTGSAKFAGSVDVIKEGNPDTKVTGIITTMFGTLPVLKKAVELNCNLIIVHEPLYYNHLDETKQFKDDPVFAEKQKYIREHNLVIWRFHDYIHRMKPDGIMTGMINRLGWNNYLVENSGNQFVLPETTLKDLLDDLKKVFPENAFHVIGDPDMKLRGVCLAPGAPGSNYHLAVLRKTEVDVMIAGEVPQWETYEYMRDAVDQGRKKAVIFLGHNNSEEAGMDFCSEWLRGFVKDLPVIFVKSGPSYWTY